MKRTYNLDGIPEQMADLHGWLYWVGNKFPITLTKDPLTGKCNHNNRDCLASLEEVLARIEQFNCPHGAFSFRPEFGLTYVDLDDCRDPQTGQLTEFASDIVGRIDSYTEVSIGRKGLHIVWHGQVERPRMHTRTKWPGRQIEIKPFWFLHDRERKSLGGNPARNRRQYNPS